MTAVEGWKLHLWPRIQNAKRKFYLHLPATSAFTPVHKLQCSKIHITDVTGILTKLALSTVAYAILSELKNYSYISMHFIYLLTYFIANTSGSNCYPLHAGFLRDSFSGPEEASDMFL
jgi:hypothetical protein